MARLVGFPQITLKTTFRSTVELMALKNVQV